VKPEHGSGPQHGDEQYGIERTGRGGHGRLRRGRRQTRRPARETEQGKDRKLGHWWMPSITRSTFAMIRLATSLTDAIACRTSAAASHARSRCSD
jgi:hypothetical protein